MNVETDEYRKTGVFVGPTNEAWKAKMSVESKKVGLMGLATAQKNDLRRWGRNLGGLSGEPKST